jgi:soluble lytic murein transglycosylase
MRAPALLALLAAATLPLSAAADALPEAARQAVASLRAGAAARERGEREAAANHFAEAARHEPAVAPWARGLEAVAWLDAGRTAQAEAAARAGLAGAPPREAAELELTIGRALARAGDAAGAQAAFERALRGPLAPERAAAVRLELAASLRESGARERANRVLLALWVESPELDEATAAGGLLAAEEARTGKALRTAPDFLRRADRLFDAQRSEAALADYDAALAGSLPAADRRRAALRRAHSLFRLRRYAEAEAAFAGLGSGAEARLWRARSMARQGEVEEAVAALEAIGGEGHGENSAWARYLAGLLHAGRGREAEAEAAFRSVADGRDASPELAGDADWQLGWAAYTRGDRAEARRRFLARAPRQRDPIEAAAARYWAARALEPDDPARARDELVAIAREWPLSYWGWRAAERVGAPAQTAGVGLPAGRVALDAGALLPARILVEAGLPEPARRALAGLDERAGGVEDRIALGRLHVAAGDFAGAETLVMEAYGEALARGPAPGQEEIWRLAWPRAWPEDLAARPPGAPVPPELLLALMREESRYQPDAVSVTGALGVLQIMPDTGRRLAAEAGVADFSPRRLLEPALAIRLGGAYLDQLAGRFPERISAAIASYNAGPEPVAEWLAADGARPDDEWVESIPYAETRKYVKRVLRSWHAYRTLHR